ncbi:MBL fold metallo-hydrolase [Persicobacter psychrovividus]|uniref:Hydrolase n=1 Tax=Persicobacter psychrovividus TaxID=387638 RepID=A0ABM7VFQ8_9BACT|nr:hydrolase [Persicobacter psychrovividus]
MPQPRLLWFLLLFIMTAVGYSFIQSSIMRPQFDSPNFNGKKFVNLTPAKPYYEYDFWATAKAYYHAKTEDRLPKIDIPVHKISAKDFSLKPKDFEYTWLGHSSFILDFEGQRFLVDPVFSERASMFSFAGPKRFHEVPITVAELPKLDAVLISHDHYDHLDAATIKSLAKETSVHFYVPLGIGHHLKGWGVSAERIHEYDWWESVQLGTVKLVCVPARHSSGRGILDQSSTLWSGWAFIGAGRKVIYSGDTADMPTEFQEIHDRFGGFDISIFQVGAYDKLWEDAHILPEQSLKANQTLGVKYMIPVHWGTFDLALHTWDAPIKALFAGIGQYQYQIKVPEVGLQQAFEDLSGNNFWWQEKKVGNVLKKAI